MLLFPTLLLATLTTAAQPYGWAHDDSLDDLASRFPAPAGFTRVPVEASSFGAWLRTLPLEPAGTPVRSHAGDVLPAHAAAVVHLDVGEKDLQQCADSIIRLRAEYLYGRGDDDGLAFHFTSGDLSRFSTWRRGFRPKVRGSKVSWRRTAKRQPRTREALLGWLTNVYIWAGTASLDERTPRATGALRPGDFLVRGGFPGHAVLILDVARTNDGRTKLLLGQGFMPAQSFHVVDGRAGAWHDWDPKVPLVIPTWPEPFTREDARRF